MTDDEPRVELRPVLDGATWKKRARDLFLAAGVCDLLVVLVVVVGIAQGWPAWVVVVVVLPPAALGAAAVLAAVRVLQARPT